MTEQEQEFFKELWKETFETVDKKCMVELPNGKGTIRVGEELETFHLLNEQWVAIGIFVVWCEYCRMNIGRVEAFEIMYSVLQELKEEK